MRGLGTFAGFAFFAVFLASCTATNPLSVPQGNLARNFAQSESTQGASTQRSAEPSQPKKPSQKAKPVAPSPILNNGSLHSTTPDVGSPEWKKEQIENAHKEERLKTIIEGICRGC